ncbi:MAG: response regulator transcription factor [Dehalococcoidia bacterium]|jgi:DNA-binding response OmpR family regulator|nr:response regulator transcription factor [Dehalococcoidia bacterium]
MKVLLLDSASEVVELVSFCLEMLRPGVTLLPAAEGSKGVSLVQAEAPDLVVLDVNLPDMDGFEVLRQIRLFSDVQVVVLTARVGSRDRIRGLDLGADDYMSRSVDYVELFARLQAVLRRSHVDRDSGATAGLEVGDIRIDPAARHAFRGGQALNLTPIEYALFAHLAQHEGRVISRRALLHKVWGAEPPDGVSYLDSFLDRLRRKLGDATSPPCILIEMGDTGYKFLRPAG